MSEKQLSLLPYTGKNLIPKVSYTVYMRGTMHMNFFEELENPDPETDAKYNFQTSNGNASETKANESFDNGVFFDIEVKRTPSIVSKLFSKRNEHIR